MHMKRLTKIVVASCVAIAATMSIVGCSGPKAIPDKDLVKIFHDAFLANAYIDVCNINQDSLLLYEPILSRYGYSVEDMQHTVSTIASRKSSRLSDLVGEASTLLEEESKMHNYKLGVLDTIDNVAKRKYTRIMYSDSLIRVRRVSDSTKLHITLGDLVPGEYTVEFDYYIDTTDENRNSRVEAYLKLHDGTQAMRHTFMLSRYRDGKYTRKFNTDTSHHELFVNIFYHPGSEEPKKPDIKVTNLTITRVIPNEQAVDSLFDEQMGAMMFNSNLMATYLEGGVKPKEEAPKPAPRKQTKTEAKQEPKSKGAETKGPEPKKPEVKRPDAKRPEAKRPEAKSGTPKPADNQKIGQGGAPKGVKPDGARIPNTKLKDRVNTNDKRPKRYDPTKENVPKPKQR